MNSKKLVSVALTATTIVWGLGIATLPLANAQSASALQAQIATLLAQIQQLQSQLNAASGGSSGSSVSASFTRDLTVGSRGSDVSALQQILINAGDLTAVSAPTGYFGPATQAALAKYQAAHGISPAAGYFGPKTRAFVASMNVGGGTSGGGTTGGGTTVTPPATGLAVSLSSMNPAAGSLISSSGNGGGSAARVPVLAINLTASNSGAVTVTDLKVHKAGVLSDSSIAGAYLIQNGQVLYQYTSLNQGTIDFSSMNLSVPAGQTVTLWVGIDPSAGLSAGNTVGFAMNSASDVTAWDMNNTAVTPSGAFPLMGNTFTVTTVSNPQLATLTTASSSIATQVTAGTQSNIVGAWQFSGSNSRTWLKGIKFTVIGSANNADLRNVKLNVNGTQVGNTLATVGANGIAYFDLSATPATVNTGSNNVQLYADVMGSPNKNFQFEILNSYDVYAVDSQYNVPVAVTLVGGAGTQVSIQQGQITVTQDSGTPTGNIAVSQSGVTFAKFDIYAAGEPVKVKFIGFKFSFTGTTTTLSNMVKNVSLVDDAGGQVGTTISTPPSSGGSAYGAAASGSACDANSGNTGAGIYVDCFGTAASPINYIIPANTTRVLSLKGDVQSGAGFSTVTASLVSESGKSNLQGLTSSATADSSGASGSALTLQSSLLTVSKNSAYGNQTITPNSTGVKIGSYAFTASSASGVQINTVSIKVAKNGTLGGTTDFQNLKLMVGGAQFGTPIGVVTDQVTYTFSGSPFTVAAGGTTYVDVYADVQSNATSTSPASSLTGCSGTSVVSFSAVSCSTTPDGQNVTVSSSGATVSIGLDSSAPAAGNLVMGSTGNALAAFRFTETTNVENVKITDLTVTQTTALSNSQAYSNVTLYQGSTAVGVGSAQAATSATSTATITITGNPTAAGNDTVTVNGQTVTVAVATSSGNNTAALVIEAFRAAIQASTTALGVTAASSTNTVTLTATTNGVGGNITLSATASQNGSTFATAVTNGSGGYAYKFHFATPPVIPQNGTLVLTLKGDVASFTSGGATDQSTSTLGIATTTDVVALGQSSNIASTISGTVTGNTLTVLRTTLTPSVGVLGNTTSRVKSSVDNIATVTLTANNAGSAMLRTLAITFSGNAISSTATSSFVLRDANNVDATTGSSFNAVQTGGPCSTSTGCTLTWTFATSTTPLVISAGGSYTFTLQTNDSNFNTGSGSASVSLSATLQAASAVTYFDNSTGSGSTISLPSTIVPASITNITFAAGT